MPAASEPTSAADGAPGAVGAPPPALPGAVEAALLRQRRLAAGVPEDAPTVGLALSGGGVRSATFGLGLLRGLAQRGQLRRVDYLSTVSGGGYIGAMFGRLVALVGIDAAQRLLAANESPVLALAAAQRALPHALGLARHRHRDRHLPARLPRHPRRVRRRERALRAGGDRAAPAAQRRRAAGRRPRRRQRGGVAPVADAVVADWRSGCGAPSRRA